MRRFRGPGKKPKLSREEKLAKRRAERKPLTPLEQAENKIRCLIWRQKQIESGLCTQCRNPASHGLYCEHHWFKMIAYSHKLIPHTACVEMLKQLWQEQDGRCALTGEKMIVGSGPRARSWNSASLDHKIARANGGTNSKENLHWVLFGVNAAKADMTLDAFVEMCRQVSKQAENKVVPLRKV
jgi:hypothetical protein